MDIFKQNRFLAWTIAVLVVLNLTTLTVLWLGRAPQPVRQARPAAQEREPAQEIRVLRDELGFDEAQIEEYRRLTRAHREEVRRLNQDIRRIKQQMFDGVLEDIPQPELSGALLAQAQQKQAEIERLTFQYLVDLKALCRADQQRQLKRLVDEIFRGAPDDRGPDRPKPADGREPPPPRPAGKRR